mmetsp:Transcript_27600/g.38119  ORF Transcript_27600/g.38119 Transcript_27600/m.38119 type:complete len:109 (-) Transcript_27600:307-633(-)
MLDSCCSLNSFRPMSKTFPPTLDTCSGLCEIHTIALPFSLSALMTASTLSVVSGSKALVGSSNNNTSGCKASVMASMARCFCPPDNSDHAWPKHSAGRARSLATCPRS